MTKRRKPSASSTITSSAAEASKSTRRVRKRRAAAAEVSPAAADSAVVPNPAGKTVGVTSGKVGRPKEPVGTAAVGRIARLQIGQSYGFIRANAREVFFHRADLAEDTTFNTLQVGDVVTFNLIEDAVSGARAMRVIRRNPTLRTKS